MLEELAERREENQRLVAELEQRKQLLKSSEEAQSKRAEDRETEQQLRHRFLEQQLNEGFDKLDEDRRCHTAEVEKTRVEVEPLKRKILALRRELAEQKSAHDAYSRKAELRIKQLREKLFGPQ